MKKVLDWIIDYAHMLKGNGLMFVHREPPKHYLGHVIKGKIPVIILPGIFNRWAFLKPMADYISLLGHSVYIVPKLGSNVADIPSSAKKVRELIDDEQIKKAIIIAHSKGGLIGKYLLAHENSDGVVCGQIAIASPFSGSAIGKVFRHRSVRELLSDSEIIKYLNTHTGVNKQIISIIPEYDNHVWHDKGSFLEGALENVRVKNRGHHKLLSDKNIWEEVVKSIDKIVNLKNKS